LRILEYWGQEVTPKRGNFILKLLSKLDDSERQRNDVYYQQLEDAQDSGDIVAIEYLIKNPPPSWVGKRNSK